MVTVIDDGWLYLSDGTDILKLFVETFKFKYIKKGTIKHYDGGINLYIPVHKSYLIAVAEGIWLDSVAKVENYQKYIKDWLDSGTFTMKFQYESGGSYLELDGDNESYNVAVKNDLGEVEKVSNGDQEYFYVDKLILEQAG